MAANKKAGARGGNREGAERQVGPAIMPVLPPPIPDHPKCRGLVRSHHPQPACRPQALAPASTSGRCLSLRLPRGPSSCSRLECPQTETPSRGGDSIRQEPLRGRPLSLSFLFPLPEPGRRAKANTCSGGMEPRRAYRETEALLEIRSMDPGSSASPDRYHTPNQRQMNGD